MRFRLVLSGVSTILIATLPETAQAGLTFCNRTDVRHSFAVAYKSGENWRSEGWWNIDPGDCSRVIGGDLSLRYYYVRATSQGRSNGGDNFFFCTLTSVFEITGEQGNCEDRGYDKSEFRQLMLDPGTTDFTFNLVPQEEGDSGTSPKEDALSLQGTFGEPYSAMGIFQECVTQTEARFCAFHAEGAKVHVYDDGRTPQSVMSFLYSLLPGDPIAVSGDMTAVYDASADAVIFQATRAATDSHTQLLAKLQGGWYAVDDPNAQFTIIGAERENTYDGQIGAVEYLSISDTCDDGPPSGGPFLIARDPAAGDTFCYAIDGVGPQELTLFYMPRGNMLRYRRLD